MDESMIILKYGMDKVYGQAKKDQQEIKTEVALLRNDIQTTQADCKKKIEDLDKRLTAIDNAYCGKPGNQSQRVEKMEKCMKESVDREAANLKIINTLQKKVEQQDKKICGSQAKCNQVLQHHDKRFNEIMDMMHQMKYQIAQQFSQLKGSLTQFREKFAQFQGSFVSFKDQTRCRFKTVNQRLDNLESKTGCLDYIKKKTKSIQQQLIQVKRKVTSIEDSQQKLCHDVARINDKIESAQLDERIHIVETLVLQNERLVVRQLGPGLKPSDFVHPKIEKRSFEKVVESKMALYKQEMTQIAIQESRGQEQKYSRIYQLHQETTDERIAEIGRRLNRVEQMIRG